MSCISCLISVLKTKSPDFSGLGLFCVFNLSFLFHTNCQAPASVKEEVKKACIKIRVVRNHNMSFDCAILNYFSIQNNILQIIFQKRAGLSIHMIDLLNITNIKKSIASIIHYILVQKSNK